MCSLVDLFLGSLHPTRPTAWLCCSCRSRWLMPKACSPKTQTFCRRRSSCFPDLSAGASAREHGPSPPRSVAARSLSVIVKLIELTMSFKNMSAPLRRSKSTIWTSPLRQATCSGVSRLLLASLIFCLMYLCWTVLGERILLFYGL